MPAQPTPLHRPSEIDRGEVAAGLARIAAERFAVMVTHTYEDSLAVHGAELTPTQQLLLLESALRAYDGLERAFGEELDRVARIERES